VLSSEGLSEEYLSGLRRFAARDFGAVERLEAQERREAYRAGGPDWAWRIALTLRSRLLALRPDWPNKRELDEDLASAVRLASLVHGATGAVHSR
jgi:hypothetical protein